MTNSMLMSPTEFLDFMLDRTGLLEMYRQENTDEAKDRLNNLQELSNAAKSYFDDNPDANLQDYLTNIALVSEPEETDLFGISNGKVTLMTLHSAKGLEFDTVFMVGMEEGLFPLSRAMDLKEELEEERRLCYVGITRAMKKLYLTHATVRYQFGESHVNPASRFLEEIPTDRTETLLPKPLDRRQEYSRFNTSWDDADFFGESQQTTHTVTKFSKPSANIGTLNYSKPQAANDTRQWSVAMVVKHRRFGVGKIISVAGTGDKTMVTVAFENNGIKNLVAAQANLEVIGE